MPLALDPLTSAVLEGLLWYAVFGLLGAGTGLALLHQQRRDGGDGRPAGRRAAGRRALPAPRHRSRVGDRAGR